MATLTYKCPSCGSPLEFDGRSQDMTCGSCGNSFETETVQQVNAIEQKTEKEPNSTNWQVEERPFSPEEAARTRSYSCSSCGAELLTDETTVATNCAFCGSPSILPTQFTQDTRPSVIIPFTVSKEQATAMFHNYFKGKKLIPNLFLRNNTIDEIRQLYVPYWLFTCQADAQITYNATQEISLAMEKGMLQVSSPVWPLMAKVYVLPSFFVVMCQSGYKAGMLVPSGI